VTGQNVYDDPDFFSAYQQMREAQSGINETVEQPAVRAMLGDVNGQDVLDLGCGDEGLCRDLVALGARSVVGIDPSARMLELAAGRTPGGRLVASMEHPVRTASPELGRHPLVVDRYADEGCRDTTWYIDGVVKYHRRLSSIVNELIDAGLVLDRLAEPTPSPAAVAVRPDLAAHVRSPAVLVMAAHKPARSHYPPSSG
jgi:SAM-dependent methyltransferase